jgi:hypothetical protein
MHIRPTAGLAWSLEPLAHRALIRYSPTSSGSGAAAVIDSRVLQMTFISILASLTRGSRIVVAHHLTAHPPRSAIHEHARVHDAGRIERPPGRPIRLREQWWPLQVVPLPVVPTNRVVVGNRASGSNDRV